MAIEKIKIGSTEHELIASGLTNESAEKVKLNGIAEGAEVNQNAFSNVVVGSTTIAADSKTDTLTIVAGSNVTITPDATNDKITIAATDTKYSHPTSSGNKHIPSGGASGQVLKWSADGTAAWGTDNDTTYSAGTGISFNGTTINNSGVRSVATGSSNGTISVNTNGTSTNVAVKGLGSAAYTASTAYATSGHTHSDYAKTADLDSVAFDGYVTKGAEAGSTIGTKATVEGDHNIASSNQAHAEGGYTRAGNLTIYSEFNGSYDSYGYEHAEGYSTLAKGNSAHAEGGYTQAISSMAHAEGISTVASGTASHAEGKETTASGYNAHAEGYKTTSSGENTHAEGNGTTASLQAAHAEGYNTTASGYASHAEGYNTKASSSYQHVQGKNNIEDTSSAYAHIVGNGSSTSARANAHTIDWDGNAWFAGDVYVGSTGGTNKDTGSKKLLKEGDVTPADIGAVNKAGDTMTGDLHAYSGANGVSFYADRDCDGNKYSANLGVFPEGKPYLGMRKDNTLQSYIVFEADKLKFNSETAGIYSTVLHTGNKNLITPEDIGAASASRPYISNVDILSWATSKTAPTRAMCSTDVTNMPTTGGYWMIDLEYAPNGIWYQLTVTNVLTLDKYENICNNGTWTGWKILSNTVTDISNTDLIDVLKTGQSGYYRGSYVTNAFDTTTWWYFTVVANNTGMYATIIAQDLFDPKRIVTGIWDGYSETINWAKLATTDYALPLDGSKAMTGVLKSPNGVYINKLGLEEWGAGEAFMKINDRNGNGSRYISIMDKTKADSMAGALNFVELIDGVYNIKTILHTGNSNKTKLVSTATTPTVNNEINWVYE